jgi:hypothetical protein
VLLAQQKLDTPFEGGLGSYKLYVLVAYHIERHLEHGGLDRPGEVLLSFLFRYGKVRRSYGGDSVGDSFRTCLSVTSTIDCAGGSADLSNVYLIAHCLKLFDASWYRLQDKLKSSKEKPSSLLDSLIDAARLRHDREKRMQLSQLTLCQYRTHSYVKTSAQEQRPHGSISSHLPGPDVGGNDRPRTSDRFPTDLTAEELVAGYRLNADFLNRHRSSSPPARSYRNSIVR